MSYEENELLDYETAAEPEPEPFTPIPVCVTEPVVTVATVAQYVICSTVVVATGTNGGVAEVLPLDPLRVRAMLIVSDQPVVLCHSKTEAQNAANTVANVPNPSGAYLPVSTTAIPIHGTARLFVAATSATAGRVTVITERRTG